MPRPWLFASLACLLAAPAWAQSKTTSSTDFAKLIQDLSTPSAHDATLAQLKKLPTTAIVPLFDAANDETRPQKTRDDLTAALNTIATRERTAAAAENERLRAAWANASGLPYYRKLSSNPKWDAQITQGLQLINQKKTAGLDLLKQGLDAGCNDPWMRELFAYNSFSLGRIDAGTAAAQMAKVLPDVESSAYPGSRKVVIISDFLWLSQQGANVPADVRRRALQYAVDHFKEFAGDHPGHTVLRQIARNLYNAAVPTHDQGVQAAKPLIDAMSAALPDDSLACFFKANYYTEWAWEARGGGFADSVTDEGWKLFHDRLELARDTAEKGWRLNPLDPDCPTVMIQVCMGEGLDQKEMESWFSRAILADPHNYAACAAKEQFLLPKWGGTEKDALDFGHWCIAHGDAQDRIPTIMIEVYKDLIQLAPNNDLLSTPQYWSDVQSVFTKLLADKSGLQSHRAQYLADRAVYVKAACDSQHWKEAAALMKEFGNDIDVNAFGGKPLYEYYKQKAAEAAGEKKP